MNGPKVQHTAARSSFPRSDLFATKSENYGFTDSVSEALPHLSRGRSGRTLSSIAALGYGHSPI
jgi:hypothetical protein